MQLNSISTPEHANKRNPQRRQSHLLRDLIVCYSFVYVQCLLFFLLLSCCCCLLACFFLYLFFRCRLYFSASPFSLVHKCNWIRSSSSRRRNSNRIDNDDCVDAGRRVSVVFEINSHLHTYITPNTAATNNDFSCNFSSLAELRWNKKVEAKKENEKSVLSRIRRFYFDLFFCVVFSFSYFYFHFQIQFHPGQNVNKK